MSEQILKLIPVRIGLIPELAEMKVIKTALENMTVYFESIKFDITPKLEYIDCGDNLYSVKCNLCNTDASEWWGDHMLNSREHDYKKRVLVTPCCHTETSLENLIYIDDIGFSKFVLEIINPSRELDPEEIETISELFGCELKMINANYKK